MPVFDGVPEIIDAWLGLEGNARYGQRVPKFRPRRASIDLSERGYALAEDQFPGIAWEPVELIKKCMRQIEANLGQPPPVQFASPNWDWQKSLHLASHNPSQEKTLEKLTAFLLDDTWVNQMPVANGLGGEDATARRIDLVQRRSDKEYDFVELKFADSSSGGSDTPLFAAAEILCYGLLYLLVRERGMIPLKRKASHHVLDADSIRLLVLAPANWYQYTRRGTRHDYDFGWLQDLLNEGLEEYVDENEIDCRCSFCFEGLSLEFVDQYKELINSVNMFRINGLAPRHSAFADAP